MENRPEHRLTLRINVGLKNLVEALNLHDESPEPENVTLLRHVCPDGPHWHIGLWVLGIARSASSRFWQAFPKTHTPCANRYGHPAGK